LIGTLAEKLAISGDASLGAPGIEFRPRDRAIVLALFRLEEPALGLRLWLRPGLARSRRGGGSGR
jgi:hypothetical protein